MSETNEIAPAWVAALAALRDVNRDQTANVGTYSYRYADLASVAQQAREVLSEHGLAVHQFAHSDTPGTVSVTTQVWHTSGQSITAPPLAMPAKGGPQDVGSAITYARRYGLMAFLGLATDDDDGAGAQKAAEEAAKPHPLSERVTAVLAGFKRMTDTDKEAMRSWADGRSLAGSALLSDEMWLSDVEHKIDEMRANEDR